MKSKMIKKPYIAFIESNTTGSGEKFILSAIKNRHGILFITANPQKYQFLRKLLIHPIVMDTSNIEKVYSYLKTIENLNAVMSSSENFVYTASVLAQRLSLKHLSPDSIITCRNKFKLANCLEQLKLPVAKTILIKSSKKILQNLDQFKFPVIVKPNIGTGSIGVKLCSSKEEVIKHIDSLSTNNSDILIQEYIQGTELSAELVVLNNKPHFFGITKKYLGQEPYFVETGHDFPTSISTNLSEQIYSTITKLIDFIGLNFGPLHIELRVTNNKIYIIEINPRLAGGMIPVLIETSQKIKLIDNLIKLYLGKKVNFTAKASIQTKIKFLIPEKSGILTKISDLKPFLKKSEIIDAQIYKNIGEKITIKGDFSDRLGFVIVKGKTLLLCTKAIHQATSNIHYIVDPKESSNNYSRQRLRSPLDPQVKSILLGSSFANLDNLLLLSKINRAHVLMLTKCNILSKQYLNTILKTIKILETDNFNSIRQQANDPEIGFYLAYEQYLTNKIGIKVAGTIHAGRSRNDINVTIQHLKSKEIFSSFYSAIWSLRSTIIQIAAKNKDINMPIYSQYQPAMPATYAYYLLAIEESLAKNMSYSSQIIENLNISTLGACSGAGTSFAINPKITANLLGFNYTSTNALSAIATRDVELHLLSIASIIGTTISRIAQDYQLWTTNEFKFFDLPDRLCGISSAMPQKKNPYLLEKIKGKAVNISSKLFAALTIIQKTPFANSVEVGTEAFINYQETFDELIKAIKLLELVIEGAKPIQKNIIRSNIEGLTISALLAEKIVQNKHVSFREAHDIIGNTISEAIANNKDPIHNILSLSKETKVNAQDAHKLLEYGGGPGNNSISNMFKQAVKILNIDSKLIAKLNK